MKGITLRKSTAMAFVCLLLLLGASTDAFAQGMAPTGDVSSIIRSVGEGIRRLLKIFFAMSGAASLVFAVLHMTKGERDAASKMWYLVLGFSIGIAVISIIDFTGTGSAGNDLTGLRHTVSSALEGALGIIMMISLALNFFKVMQGDQQALRKAFTLACVGSVGMVLLGLPW